MRCLLIKADLVRKVAEAADLNLKESEVVVDRLFSAITEILQKGERLELRGFGTFGVRRVKAKVGRNLATGEPVPIPPYNKPYFKPGIDLKPWPLAEIYRAVAEQDSSQTSSSGIISQDSSPQGLGDSAGEQ